MILKFLTLATEWTILPCADMREYSDFPFKPVGLKCQRHARGSPMGSWMYCSQLSWMSGWRTWSPPHVGLPATVSLLHTQTHTHTHVHVHQESSFLLCYTVRNSNS